MKTCEKNKECPVLYFNLFRFYNLKQKTIKGGVGFIGYGF